ncbi:hypothetical protein V8G54_015915 [Vigna mungo]|uniref:Uncharacterized protein n=1 Tax=Vigna mungo TaxID=3915 RepID=A0AAQ3NJC2_VIGMU
MILCTILAGMTTINLQYQRALFIIAPFFFFLSFSIAHPFSRDHKIHYHRVSNSISNSTLEFSATHFDPNPEESARGFHVPHHLSDTGGAAVPNFVAVRIPRAAVVAEVAFWAN